MGTPIYLNCHYIFLSTKHFLSQGILTHAHAIPSRPPFLNGAWFRLYFYPLTWRDQWIIASLLWISSACVLHGSVMWWLTCDSFCNLHVHRRFSVFLSGESVGLLFVFCGCACECTLHDAYRSTLTHSSLLKWFLSNFCSLINIVVDLQCTVLCTVFLLFMHVVLFHHSTAFIEFICQNEGTCSSSPSWVCYCVWLPRTVGGMEIGESQLASPICNGTINSVMRHILFIWTIATATSQQTRKVYRTIATYCLTTAWDSC